jgi:hypothetical protein
MNDLVQMLSDKNIGVNISLNLTNLARSHSRQTLSKAFDRSRKAIYKGFFEDFAREQILCSVNIFKERILNFMKEKDELARKDEHTLSILFTKESISNTLMKLKSGKAPGIDEIPNNFLKFFTNNQDIRIRLPLQLTHPLISRLSYYLSSSPDFRFF